MFFSLSFPLPSLLSKNKEIKSKKKGGKEGRTEERKEGMEKGMEGGRKEEKEKRERERENSYYKVSENLDELFWTVCGK